ncbi:CapA family protein [Alkaliphilus crotonatoxidans]
MKKYRLIAVMMALFLIVGCNPVKGRETDGDYPNLTDHKEPVIEGPAFKTIVISGVGDIMVHGPQISAQFQPETKTYDFRNNFQYIKPFIQKADISIANLETTFAGAERGYSSFPQFNTPDALADSLVDAGFNAISTANNHTYDTGTVGVKRTLSVLWERGLKTMGTRQRPEEKSYVILEEKGIKVGLTAFTYETPRWEGHKTINALKLSEEAAGLIDTFSYEYLEEDLERIKQRIQDMRAEGAEIIVFYIHWGEEYQREPNDYQRKIAQRLSDLGVDIIFGSHPHVVQPIEIIESQVNQHQTLVVYSMGNFLSNQRYEILKNRYTEDGLMVSVTLKKNMQTQEISIETVDCIPTWVHRYYINQRGYYEIVPVMEALKHPEQYNLFSEDSRKRCKGSKENSLDILQSDNPKIRIQGLDAFE